MSIQAAKEELKSLTDFQREIHVTSNLSEDIISLFYRNFIKSTWYSSIPMKLKCTADGNEIVYSVNNSFHFLMYTYMRTYLSPVRVRPEYKGRVRIAWCHNVGTNCISLATFKEDDDTYQTWDSVWADIYFQFYQNCGAGKRENHNIGIGNVKCLEEWTDFLPGYPLNVDQPWFYSMHHETAFPTHYKGSQTRAEHRYNLVRKVTDLLRVQILGKDGKWKDTTRKVHTYLDINSNATLRTPELWGRYTYITEPELKWYRCKPSRHYYIRNVEVCDTPNPNRFNSTSEVDLQCTTPCLAFFWVAENMDARAVHNYSNYTTNTQDLYEGWDPVKSTTLKYGTITRLDNMPSDHFSIAEPRKHFPSAPCDRGYHGYSYAWDSTSFNGDIGIVFANMGAKLQCKIANTDIYNLSYNNNDNNDDEDEEEDEIIDSFNNLKADNSCKLDDIKVLDTVDEASPSFITRVRLLVLRKFTIYGEGDKFTFSVK